LVAIYEVEQLLWDDRGGRVRSDATDVLQVLRGAVFRVFMVFEEWGTGGCMHQALAQGVAGLPGQGRLLAPCSGKELSSPALGKGPLPPVGTTEPVGG